MTTIADQLGTTYFQLSTVGVGALAVGIEDIRQRMFNVLNSIPGSDPFRPLFGCLAYTYTDKPVTTAIPNIKKEIFESLSLWMPEIQVITIAHTADVAQLYFTVSYGLVDTDLVDSVTFSIGGSIDGSGISNGIVITAAVPAPFTGGIYRVKFLVDGTAVVPAIPDFGFSSPAEMLSWINNNWSNYGRWYLTGSSLVLYLNSGIANTVVLSVTETPSITIRQLIPELAPAAFYNLQFQANGVSAIPDFPGSINTVESLLLWIRSNWSGYGNWFVQTESTASEPGDLNADFNNDFSTGAIVVYNYLVLQSDSLTSATLNFN